MSETWSTYLPRRVTIELTNDCQLKCPWCPRNRMEYPVGYMSEELFIRIVDQLQFHTVIVPFFRGESLLHPKFEDLMWEIRLRRFKDVQLATNGLLLDYYKAGAIYDVCSFVSITLTRYWIPVVGVKPEPIVRFLQGARFHDIETQVSIVRTAGNAGNDWELWREQWLRYAQRARIYEEHSRHGIGSVDKHPLSGSRHRCARMLENMVIYWDGKVGLCNHDWNNLTRLGNVNDHTIEEIWNGSRYQRVRELNEKCVFDNLPSCRDCDQWSSTFTIGETHTK